MCVSSHKSAPPPPPAPPPVNPPQAPNVLQGADGTKRSDSAASNAMRGRNSLRIDRSSSTLGGGGGTGLNIPS